MAEPARLAAAVAAVQLAARFPDLPLIEPETGRLSDADARLCTAIHRHSLQRWLTIEAVLQGALRQPVGKLDPVVRGVLINAGAQLLFMDRLPDYAVIDGAVALTRKLDRKRATGLVNTTLRKVAGLIVGRDDGPWTPAANALPWPGGGTPGGEGVAVVHLGRALLPKPDNLLAHLSVATSLPLPLLQQWFKLFGREQATALAMQSLATPPTYVVEDESPRRWEGSHAELVDFLAAAPGRRVQDPASLASVAAAATVQIAPGRVLDLCAGRGTKSRQLAAVFPEAVVDAWDPDADRAADLSSAADMLANLNALDAPPQPLPEHGGGYGLVVLDVPCSNTGVLARRPGARYRATARGRDSLVALQQKIIATGLAQAAAGGHVLYCTCSIDPAENQDQTQWLLAQAGAEAEVVVEDTLLPLAGPEGHDGSYHALIRLGGR